MLNSFLNRFSIDFCFQLGHPELQESLKTHWFYNHFLLFDVFKKRSIFDPVWVPTCVHFYQRIHQNRSKNDFERHRFLDRFWPRFFIDLGSTWGPIVRPCWPLFRAQNGPPSRYSPLCLHVGSMLSLLAPFLTFPAPSWPHFDSILEDLKYILQVLGCHFAFDFYLSAKGSAEWAKPF